MILLRHSLDRTVLYTFCFREGLTIPNQAFEKIHIKRTKLYQNSFLAAQHYRSFAVKQYMLLSGGL